MTEEVTLTRLRRKTPPARAEQLQRMARLLEGAGLYASWVDIECAWYAVCLTKNHRPAWEHAQFVNDSILLTWLRAELEEAPASEDDDIEEPDDAEASEEQDDGGTTEGEDSEEPAEVEGQPETASERAIEAAPRRRGRPPGKRKIVDSF
jgi:hypothetical protein